MKRGERLAARADRAATPQLPPLAARGSRAAKAVIGSEPSGNRAPVSIATAVVSAKQSQSTPAAEAARTPTRASKRNAAARDHAEEDAAAVLGAELAATVAAMPAPQAAAATTNHAAAKTAAAKAAAAKEAAAKDAAAKDAAAKDAAAKDAAAKDAAVKDAAAKDAATVSPAKQPQSTPAAEAAKTPTRASKRNAAARSRVEEDATAVSEAEQAASAAVMTASQAAAATTKHTAAKGGASKGAAAKDAAAKDGAAKEAATKVAAKSAAARAKAHAEEEESKGGEQVAMRGEEMGEADDGVRAGEEHLGCPFHGCTSSETSFHSFPGLREHLRDEHELDEAQISRVRELLREAHLNDAAGKQLRVSVNKDGAVVPRESAPKSAAPTARLKAIPDSGSRKRPEPSPGSDSGEGPVKRTRSSSRTSGRSSRYGEDEYEDLEVVEEEEDEEGGEGTSEGEGEEESDDALSNGHAFGEGKATKQSSSQGKGGAGKGRAAKSEAAKGGDRPFMSIGGSGAGKAPARASQLGLVKSILRPALVRRDSARSKGSSAPPAPPVPDARSRSKLLSYVATAGEREALGLLSDNLVRWDDSARTRAGILPMDPPGGSLAMSSGTPGLMYRVAIASGRLSEVWAVYLGGSQDDLLGILPAHSKHAASIEKRDRRNAVAATGILVAGPGAAAPAEAAAAASSSAAAAAEQKHEEEEDGDDAEEEEEEEEEDDDDDDDDDEESEEDEDGDDDDERVNMDIDEEESGRHRATSPPALLAKPRVGNYMDRGEDGDVPEADRLERSPIDPVVPPSENEKCSQCSLKWGDVAVAPGISMTRWRRSFALCGKLNWGREDHSDYMVKWASRLKLGESQAAGSAAAGTTAASGARAPESRAPAGAAAASGVESTSAGGAAFRGKGKGGVRAGKRSKRACRRKTTVPPEPESLDCNFRFRGPPRALFRHHVTGAVRYRPGAEVGPASPVQPIFAFTVKGPAATLCAPAMPLLPVPSVPPPPPSKERLKEVLWLEEMAAVSRSPGSVQQTRSADVVALGAAQALPHQYSVQQ